MTSYTHCTRNLTHHWDEVSGWCVHGCGFRDDGRTTYRRPPAPLEVPDITEPRHRRAGDQTQEDG